MVIGVVWDVAEGRVFEVRGERDSSEGGVGVMVYSLLAVYSATFSLALRPYYQLNIFEEIHLLRSKMRFIKYHLSVISVEKKSRNNE